MKVVKGRLPDEGPVRIGPDGIPDDALRPWDSGEFIPPEDPRDADSVDVGAFLSSEWGCWVPPLDEDDPERIQMLGPFTRKWPIWTFWWD